MNELILIILIGFVFLLYGIKLFNDKVVQLYDAKVRNYLKGILQYKFLGLAMGVVLTILFQSSTIVTVFIVTLVHSHFLRLEDVVAIIIGANIGSSIIAFFLIDKSFVPLVVLLLSGTIFWFFGNREYFKLVGESFIALAIIIFGLLMIQEGQYPMSQQEWFLESISKIHNPILGLPVGIGISTLMQSSNLSTAILEKIALIENLKIEPLLALIAGNNIGTTTTALVSSIHCTRDAKRAATIHFIFNVIGTLLFLTILRIPAIYIVKNFTDDISLQIRITHLIFNLATGILFYFNMEKLLKFSKYIIPVTDEDHYRIFKYIKSPLNKNTEDLIHLSKKEIVRMGKILKTNLEYTSEAILSQNNDKISSILYSRRDLSSLSKNIVFFLSELDIEDSQIERERIKLQNILLRLIEIHNSISSIMKLFNNRKVKRTNITSNFYDQVRSITQNINYSMEKCIYVLENDDEEAALDIINLREFIGKKIDKAEDIYLRDINGKQYPFQVTTIYLRILFEYNSISLSCEEVAYKLLDFDNIK